MKLELLVSSYRYNPMPTDCMLDLTSQEWVVGKFLHFFFVALYLKSFYGKQTNKNVNSFFLSLVDAINSVYIIAMLVVSCTLISTRFEH